METARTRPLPDASGPLAPYHRCLLGRSRRRRHVHRMLLVAHGSARATGNDEPRGDGSARGAYLRGEGHPDSANRRHRRGRCAARVRCDRGGASGHPPWSRRADGNGKDADRRHVTPPTQESAFILDIEGMTCASCVAHVERALQDHPSVLDAHVSLASRTAAVRCRLPEPEPLINAIDAAGYRARARQVGDPVVDERRPFLIRLYVSAFLTFDVIVFSL